MKRITIYWPQSCANALEKTKPLILEGNDVGVRKSDIIDNATVFWSGNDTYCYQNHEIAGYKFEAKLETE